VAPLQELLFTFTGGIVATQDAGLTAPLQISFPVASLNGPAAPLMYVPGITIDDGVIVTQLKAGATTGTVGKSYVGSAPLQIGDQIAVTFPATLTAGEYFSFSSPAVEAGGSFDTSSTVVVSGTNANIVTVTVAGAVVSAGTVTLRLAGATNPAEADTTAPFQITLTQGTPPSGLAGVTLLGPIAVTPVKLVTGQTMNSANTESVRVQFRSAAANTGLDTIAITFPTGFVLDQTVIGRALSSVSDGGVGPVENINTAGVTFTHSGQVCTVSLPGLARIAGALDVSFYIDGVTNPIVAGLTDRFSIVPSWHTVAQGAFISIPGVQIAGALSVTTQTQKLGQDGGILTIRFTPDVALSAGDSIVVVLPSGNQGFAVATGPLSLDAHVPATDNFDDTAATATGSNGDTITIIAGTAGVTADTAVTIRILGGAVRNPFMAGETGTFTITPQNGDTFIAPGVVIENGIMHEVTDTGQASLVTTVSYVSASALPSGSLIVLTFPTTPDVYDLSSNTISFVMNDGSTTNFDMSTASVRVTATNTELTVTTGTAMAAGKVKFFLTGLVNPSLPDPSFFGRFDISTVAGNGESYTGLNAAPILGELSVTLPSTSVGHSIDATDANDFIQVKFVPSRLLEQSVSDTIDIVFPVGFEVKTFAARALSLVLTPTPASIATSTYEGIAESRTIRVTLAGDDIVADTQVILFVDGVVLPTTAGTYGFYEIRPAQGNLFLRVLGDDITGVVSIVPDNLFAGQGYNADVSVRSGTVDVLFRPSVQFPQDGKLRIVFPLGFRVGAPTDVDLVAAAFGSPYDVVASNLGGDITYGPGSSVVSGVVAGDATTQAELTITFALSGAVDAGIDFRFKIDGVENPYTAGVTGLFALYPMINAGTQIGDNFETIPGVTIVQQCSVSLENVYTSMPAGAITVSFTPSVQLNAGEFIHVTFPSSIQVVSGGVTLDASATNLNDNTLLAANAALNRVELTLAGASTLADTPVVFVLRGLQNSANAGDGGFFVIEPSLGDSFRYVLGTTLLDGAVSTLVPNNGVLTGGTVVIIQGQGLHRSDVTSVTLNGVAATVMNQANSAFITIMTGDASVGITSEGQGDVVITSTSVGITTVLGAWRYNSPCCFRNPHPESCPTPAYADPTCFEVVSSVYP
jgi:hypothetical protein